MQQKIQQAQANGVFPETPGQQKPFNNSNWQGQQQAYGNWRAPFNPGRPPFRGNFNQGSRPRFGNWQNFRPSWGGNWGQQQPNWPQQQNWQQPPPGVQQAWNQQNWNPQGWSPQNWNPQGWNQQGPSPPVPQLTAPPAQQGDKDKVPQSSFIDVEIPQEHGANHVLADCYAECDCHQCSSKEPKAFVVTRSKAKLKSPLDWEDQKDVRDEAADKIVKAQDSDSSTNERLKTVKNEEGKKQKSEALFQELLNTPMNFTLDQLLSLVPIFRDRFYSATRKSKLLEVLKELEQNVGSYQINPDDVDFTVPTVELEFDGQIFLDVLLDGGSGVNILSETKFLKLKNAKLEPTPFQVRMVDQRRVQLIGMLRGQLLKVHGLQFQANFVVLKMQDAGKAYAMLLGRPWFKTAKLKQDWEKNEVILKKGKKSIRFMMGSKKNLSLSDKPMMSQSFNLAEEIADDEEECFLEANLTVIPIFEVDVERIFD